LPVINQVAHLDTWGAVTGWLPLVTMAGVGEPPVVLGTHHRRPIVKSEPKRLSEGLGGGQYLGLLQAPMGTTFRWVLLNTNKIITGPKVLDGYPCEIGLEHRGIRREAEGGWATSRDSSTAHSLDDKAGRRLRLDLDAQVDQVPYAGVIIGSEYLKTLDPGPLRHPGSKTPGPSHHIVEVGPLVTGGLFLLAAKTYIPSCLSRSMPK